MIAFLFSSSISTSRSSIACGLSPDVTPTAVRAHRSRRSDMLEAHPQPPRSNPMSDRAGPRREPMTEQDLRAAWVVEPPRLTGKIQVVDHDPEWPRLFQREAQRINEVLGQRVVRLEHIGSTSVPGLAAKPVIDILLVVPDSSDEPSYVPDLEAAGYVLVIREPAWYQHRCCKGPDTNINLHVYSPRLPGDRAVPRLPRPAARPPGGAGALPAGQA
jgi:hypothetical protein